MNIFSQSPATYKISFTTYFQYIERFEEFFTENILSISTYEVESSTVDSKPNDIWCFEAYLDCKPDLPALQSQLAIFVTNNNLILLSEIACERLEDQDWVSVYQSNLTPLEIGRFFISPAIHKARCPKDKIGLIIEASRAFGTGEHATTSGCIQAMEKLAEERFDHILDLGTGTGILSFAAEKIWPCANVLACDIDLVAVQIAKDGGVINNSKVNFFQNKEGEILSEAYKELRFNLIISNILAKPLIDLANSVKNIAAKNSYAILSGFLDYQATEVLSAYQENGFELVGRIDNGAWAILIIKVKKN